MRRVNVITLLLTTIIALMPAAPAAAAPVNWSEAYPTTGAVTIPAGATVVLDTDLDLSGLRINGTVTCGHTRVSLKARWIVVAGEFQCGTHLQPFAKRLTITLKGPGEGNFNGYGDKYLVVESGGRFELHGKRRQSWTTLAETASAGATQIRVADPAWKAGDHLVIAPTNYYMHQTEEVTVASRQGDVLTLTEPLSREHYCGTDTYRGRKLKECAEVGLLTHNIVVQGGSGSTATRIGGHAMFLHGSTVKIEDAEFRRMGQLGRLARYPIHFHHVHHSDAYVRRTSIHHAYNRFITIHGTHNVTVREVVGYDTVGHGFYLEDGSETGNRFIDNLGILVRGAESATAVTPSDTQASTFWISNPDNTLNGNVAAGADFAGFWLGFPEHPVGDTADPNVWPRRTPLRSFRNNTAHTVGFAGLYLDGGEDANRNTVTTWYEPRQDPSDPNSPHVTPEIKGFKAWKSNHYGFWIRTFSGFEITGAKLADNWRSFYLANIATGPTRDNVGVVKNSLLVGTSSNHGQPENWEVVDVNGHTVPMHWEPDAPLGGVPFYDGPMHIESTVLANFTPNATRNAGALTSLFPNVFTISVLNTTSDLTFKNSKRVFFPEVREGRQGDAGTMFTDLDGSVTGDAGTQVVVDPTLLDNATCMKKPAWHASICDKNYARIYVSRTDGLDIGADVTRVGDGRTVFVRGSSNPDNSMGLNLMTGTPYTVDFRAANPSGYGFWTGEFSGGAAVRIAVPAPSGSWDVTIWGVADPEVGSLGELNSGPAGYYHESATGLIHLRFTPQHRGGEIG